LEAVIVGALCALGMTLFNMPYAVSVGVCVGVMALVPIFGAWLGGIVGFLMVLTVSLNQAIMFVVFLLILQQLESHLIYPNVVGSMVDLPGIWVFSGVLVGGTLFGVFGMLLGVPSIATVRTLVMEHMEKIRTDRTREASLAGPIAIGDPSDVGGFGRSTL
jgi:predicted PurR-regulated permease PerM